MLSEQLIEMQSSGRVVFGSGEVTRIGELVRETGATQVFLVADPGIVASGLMDVVKAGLDVDLRVGSFEGVTPSPTTEDIEAGSDALREFGLRDTVVVAVGGGSSLDAAKGLSLHAANEVPVAELDFRAENVRPGVPIVAVPTTAGTGSETNHFGVVTDLNGPKKVYVGHPSVKPRATILDPILTVKLPPGPTAATGMDAMVHALEALVSRSANPYADGVALQVISMVNRWLPAAVSDGENIEARSRMLLASHMAGLAFSSGTGLGLCHAIAHSISSHTGAVHGVALTAVLPEVMSFNLPESSGKLALAAKSLDVYEPSAPEKENARAAVRAIEDLSRKVLDASVSGLGVTEDLVPVLVEDTLSDLVIGNTPRMPSAGEVREILTSA
ncbi:MAG: iron-containing alcohol dehydrogenase [Rubrobacteraceae bacterium]